MNLEIETDAAITLLKVLLSCQCPISKKTEEEIAQYILPQRNKPSIDYKKIIEIAGGPKKDTVFKRLRDCCFYSKNNLDEVVITKKDIYKHFCSAYHWKINEETFLSTPERANTPITNAPSWFIGHMLLPVKLTQEKGSTNAEYAGSGFKIHLFNVFTPPDIKIQTNRSYAIHFASVISEINIAQSRIISQQLDTIDKFTDFRRDVKAIDYSDFQKFGDYRRLCESRYSKYF